MHLCSFPEAGALSRARSLPHPKPSQFYGGYWFQCEKFVERMLERENDPLPHLVSRQLYRQNQSQKNAEKKGEELTK